MAANLGDLTAFVTVARSGGMHSRNDLRRERTVNMPAKAILSLLLLSAVAVVTTTDSWADTIPGIRSDRGNLPSDPPTELKRLIGEYSSADTRAYGPEETRLTIAEAGGKLFADGLGLHAVPLRRLAAMRFSVDGADGQPTHLDFELDRGQRASAVVIGSTRRPLRDIGREVMETIRAGVKADPAGLRNVALAAKPPVEPAPKRASDLINLATVDPTIKFDIRYASSNNFIGFPLYEWPAAYLQRPAAEALGRVERALASKGYGLLVYDGYRPWFVTKMFWDATPEMAHVFVADPSKGSRHNRGCAVDLTLYDLKSGRAVEMTGRYDEMSRRSYADYVGGTSRQRWLRDMLRNEMEAQGFAVYPEEWWHFDYKDWGDYAIGTATFSQLDSAPHAPSP
jgi:zinc D-Ala-D-Ala dipeptidase